MLECRVSVRALAEFGCMAGDLCPAQQLAQRMQEGAAVHRLRQEAYPPAYEREAPVLTREGVRLTLHGRADGLCRGCALVNQVHPWTCGRCIRTDPPTGRALLYARMLQEAEAQECPVRLVYVHISGMDASLDAWTGNRDRHCLCPALCPPQLRPRRPEENAAHPLCPVLPRQLPTGNTNWRESYLACATPFCWPRPPRASGRPRCSSPPSKPTGGHVRRIFYLTAGAPSAAVPSLENAGPGAVARPSRSPPGKAAAAWWRGAATPRSAPGHRVLRPAAEAGKKPSISRICTPKP